MAKRTYNSWSQNNMDIALNEYRNGKLKFNEACRIYKIPKPTFRRHLKGLNVHQRIGRPNDLHTEMEDELVNHILQLEKRFFGITIRDLRHLAFQLAEKYKLPHRFNKEKKLAGWKWYYKFLKNHPEISLRTPEPTSIARCKGFNKKSVMDFFDIYEALLDEGKFLAHQIYNVDETGLSTVHKPSKILALKGKHQVGAVTSGERGINTTCVCCMNAAGEFIPPMLIYKRKRLTDDLKKGGPPNTVYCSSESGWITSELFLDWLRHFIKCTKLEKLKKNQILLILDGHATHTKNIEAINLARDYGIVMLSLPPHTTHKLQPLDISFFKPLKQNFNSTCSSWMRNHPGSVVKQSNISEILGTAYPRAVCMETAIHGFESCGLWPCNRFKIRDDEYVVDDDVSSESKCEQASKASTQRHNITDKSDGKENVSSEEIRSEIQSISPLSTLQQSNRVLKKSTTAQVLTKSPYKKELLEKLQESKKKTVRQIFNKQSATKRNNTDEEMKNKKNKKKKEEDWYCKLCEENIQENMIQCTECETWVHDLCAGIDKNTHNYLCDDCKELEKTIRLACTN